MSDYDDDDGPGFLQTAALLSLAAGGAFLLWKTLNTSAAAATPGGATGGSTGNPLTDLSQLLNFTPGAGSTGDVLASTGQGMPLGIANNNPGNIRWSAANNWDGQIGQDANGFVIFSDPVFGLRALFKLLETYKSEIEPIGVFDILSISRRWTTTQQDAWAANVSAAAGFPQTMALDTGNAAQMASLANGIVVAENGGQFSGYYAGQVDQAYQLAA
jgi:hypothetical protein